MRTHIHYMKKCIALGKEAMLNGNPPVGSILVSNSKIIGIGKEAGKSGNDITRHAEIEAIRSVNLEDIQLIKNSTLYTTHEPCIMCSYVIRHHQIPKVVFGIKSKYVGGLSSAFNLLETKQVPGWKSQPEIIEGILKHDCSTLSQTYQSIQKK